MRVLEAKPVATQTMGKKKHKLHKKSQDNEPGASDSSDELVPSASGGVCPHIGKAVNLNTTRKALRQQGKVGECTSCERQKSKEAEKAEGGEPTGAEACAISESLLDEVETTVWVCLQCGNQGCDRNSREKHALKHYGTPRSTSHALVLNTTTWNVWCYVCDDDVSGNSSRKLFECVDFIKKFSGATRPESQPISSLRRTGSGRNESLGANHATVDNSSAGREEKGKGVNRCNTPPGQVTVPLGLPKVKGLNNLGNTCFFNAVLQNLSQTPGLECMISDWGKKGVRVSLSGQQSLEEDSDSCTSSTEEEEDPHAHLDLEPLNFELGEAGTLTQSVLTFLRDMNAPTKSTTISPSVLFGQICRKAPRFKGFQQQDSHELLRYLLDGMRADEIKRWQIGILRAFQLPDNVNPKKVDEETRSKIKVYGRQVKHTFVDNIFGGYFISTVLCEDCRTPSQIFEPFLDISLPITEEKPSRPNVWGLRKKDSKMLETSSEPSLPEYSATDRPKKHLSKKARKQARREAKRKARGSKNKVAPKGGQSLPEADSGVEENEQADASVTSENREDLSLQACSVDGSREDSVSIEYSDSKSDADDSDVEDNAESDVSRSRFTTHRLACKQQSMSPLNSHKFENNRMGCEKCITAVTQTEDVAQYNGPTLANDENLALPNDIDSQPSTSVSSGNKGTISISQDKLMLTAQVNEEHDSALGTLQDEDILTAKVGSLGITESYESHANVDGLLHADKSSQGDLSKGNTCGIKSCESTLDNKPETPKEKRHSSLKLEAQLMAMNSLVPRLHTAIQECSVLSCLNQFTAAELLTGTNRFGCEHCTKRKNGRHSRCSSADSKADMMYTNASKQVLIFQPPAVLTLHLKRFQQMGFTLRKVNRHVQFPVELDLAPYCSSLAQGIKCGQKQVLYGLYGVVEHSGRLSGGHYTAYVKVRPKSENLKEFFQQNDINGIKLHRLLELLREKMSLAGEEQEEDLEKTATAPGKWYYISDSRVSEVTEAAVLRCQAYLLFYERVF